MSKYINRLTDKQIKELIYLIESKVTIQDIKIDTNNEMECEE